jgi:hypothetical protein
MAAQRWGQKMTKTLSRRLERLEEQMMPTGEPTVLQIVCVDSAGNRTDGPKFEVPSYRPGHDRRRGARGGRQYELTGVNLVHFYVEPTFRPGGLVRPKSNFRVADNNRPMS